MLSNNVGNNSLEKMPHFISLNATNFIGEVCSAFYLNREKWETPSINIYKKHYQTYPFDLLIKQMATNSSQYGTLMALLKKWWFHGLYYLESSSDGHITAPISILSMKSESLNGKALSSQQKAKVFFFLGWKAKGQSWVSVFFEKAKDFLFLLVL